MNHSSNNAVAQTDTDSINLESGHLSRLQLTSLAISSMIPAVGMASFPMLLVLNAGLGGWVAALLAALTVICVGRAVTVFASRYVASGSLYSYAGEVFGRWAQSLIAASLFLGYLAMVASILLVIGAYSGSFLQSIGIDGGLDRPAQIAIYLASAAIVAAITCRGLDVSIVIAVLLTAICLPLLLAITGASAIHTGLHLQEQLTLQGASVSGIVAGIASGTAFLVGFEGSAALAAETRDPKKNVPAAVMSVPIVLGTLYVIATFLQAPGITETSDQILSGTSSPAALAENAGLPTTMGQMTDLVVAVATFAALIGFVNYGSRFVATLSAEKLLPQRFTRIHSRFHSPVSAILLIILGGLFGICTLVIGATGPLPSIYNAVSTLVVYFWVSPYVVISIGAVMLLFRERAATAVTIAALIAGAVATSWIYLNGIFFPTPSPVSAMSYVALATITPATIAFYLMGRRSHADASQPPPHLNSGRATTREQ